MYQDLHLALSSTYFRVQHSIISEFNNNIHMRYIGTNQIVVQSKLAAKKTAWAGIEPTNKVVTSRDSKHATTTTPHTQHASRGYRNKNASWAHRCIWGESHASSMFSAISSFTYLEIFTCCAGLCPCQPPSSSHAHTTRDSGFLPFQVRFSPPLRPFAHTTVRRRDWEMQEDRKWDERDTWQHADTVRAQLAIQRTRWWQRNWLTASQAGV